MICRQVSGRLLVLLVVGVGLARAQEGAAVPHWIWHPNPTVNGLADAETRWFRKAFHVKEVSRIALDVTADNSFTLYLDGRKIVEGDTWQTAKSFQGTVATGWHVLAAEAKNEAPGPAAFLLRGGILPLGQGVPIHTDSSWKVTDRPPADDRWKTDPQINPEGWIAARDLGPLGTEPWVGIVFESGLASDRFRIAEGYTIATAAPPSLTGSVVAFAFDPDGRPCVSVERGPIVRLLDLDKDGTCEEKQILENQVTNCQGLAFVDAALYAVGDGPQGTGVYRLADPDGDGLYADAEVIRLTDGGMGEHGPHAVMLGPDGLLYLNVGNHAHLKPPIVADSPVNRFTEGELLPHYNDSRGHAAGIMAPGGEIYRSPDGGDSWERVSAGYRNHYDFAFNRDGEIFTFDSDMEWDIGLPWYRQVGVFHAPLGSEMGWRNGSAVWPQYYPDCLPATLDVGRGSPTGVAVYQGRRLAALDDALLVCDWSQGRILAVQLEIKGGTYAAKATELVTGQPLNCTDIEAGPDGAIYFSTGGRGTIGGLFRIDRVTDSLQPVRSPAATASINTAFGRKRLLAIAAGGEKAWGKPLLDTATDSEAPVIDRLQALDLLTQFGPPLPTNQLATLARSDPELRIRAKAVGLLGLRPAEQVVETLTQALADPHPFVRRKACEALVRARAKLPIEPLMTLLGDEDRFVRFAARNALEHADVAALRERLLSAKAGFRPLIEGMLILVRATPGDAESQGDLIKRQAELFAGELPAAERLDLLRVIGLTLLRGPAKSHPAVQPIADKAVELFPTGDPALDVELSRLLAALDDPRAVAEIVAVQAATEDTARQIHYSNCLRCVSGGWTAESKQAVMNWFEKASRWDGGFSYLGYLDFMIQDILPRLDEAERLALIRAGDRLPFPARVLVRSLELSARPQLVGELEALDERLDGASNESAARELRTYLRDRLKRAKLGAAAEALARLEARDRARQAPAVPAAIVREYTLAIANQAVLESGLMARASAERGKAALTKARCLDCHKFGDQGKGVGPDLTTLSSRFKPIDILEAIVEPSKVISDQYRSVTVETTEGVVLNGMPVVNDDKTLVLLLADGTQQTIPKAEIAEQKPATVSVMPEGLINTLTSREIADMLKLFDEAPRVPVPPPPGQ